MCGSLGNSNYTVITHILAGPQPNSSRWGLRHDGRNSRSGKLCHSNDEIGACTYLF